MRILFLTSRLPYPPDRGDRLRTFHLLRTFAEDHDVTLASFAGAEEVQQHLPVVREITSDVHVVVRHPAVSAAAAGVRSLGRKPLQASYYHSRRMARLVERLLSEHEFDVAYCHLFRMAPYLSDRRGVYRIVDLTDVISEEIALSMPHRRGLSRLLYRWELPRIRSFERLVARTFEETWLISEHGRQTMLDRCPGSNIRVITNGVDLQAFDAAVAGRQGSVGQGMVFVGNLSVFHNIDAALFLAGEVLPRVRRTVPDCVLTLAGAQPVKAVRDLADLPGVRVTGYVEDLPGLLASAGVFVAPLRFAAGVQNKVLEAMAAATPVVTTPVVQAGLAARPGHDLLIGADADELADAVVRVMTSDSLASSAGARGRDFVATRFSWDRARERLRQLEQELGA